MGLLCAAAGAGSTAAGGLRAGRAAGGAAAEAVLGPPVVGARATGGAAAKAVLGQPAASALGLELTIGGGEVQRTCGRKECALRVLFRCLVSRKLQKCVKGPKLHQGKICIKPQKAGQKAVNNRSVGEQCCEICRLRIFATLLNFHYAFLLFCIFALNLLWFDHAFSNSSRVHRV